MKTEIYLLRHAEPMNCYFPSNENKQIANEKIPLSVNGEKSAEQLFKSNFFNDIDLVVSSSYVRSISTAKYLLKNKVELLINPLFNERKLGDEEREPEFWLQQLYDQSIKNTNGESQLEVRNRMFAGIGELLSKNLYKKIAIVSHGMAITFLLMNWCKLEDANLDGKVRKLSFNGKTIINDRIKYLDIFKLVFVDNKIVSIEKLSI